MNTRAQVDIDWGVVGKLLEADCKTVDIAAQFGVTTRTLYRRCKTDLGMSFVSLSQQKRASGDNILRAKQFQTAMSGNVPMLIWLGKNRLGQADKTEITGADGGPIQTQTTVFDHGATVAGITQRSGVHRGESGED